MTHASSQKDGLADGMPRDDRGYWQPDKEIGAPNPIFAWPPKANGSTEMACTTTCFPGPFSMRSLQQ